MKAARIHKFGPSSVIVIEELPRPAPGMAKYWCVWTELAGSTALERTKIQVLAEAR